MAQVQVRVQVQVLSFKYKYNKYIGLPLAMQMKLNKIHESWLQGRMKNQSIMPQALRL